jgi:hypothetical protein
MTKRYWRHGGKRPKAALRDFGRKRYGNPLFNAVSSGTRRRHDGQARRRGEKRGLTLVIVTGLAVTAAVGWTAWYLLWSPAFRITEIAVSGVSPETEATVRSALDERLAKHRLLILPQDNLLAFSGRSATEDIAAKVFLTELRLRKKFPHQIVVEAKESEVAAILAVKSGLLALDKEGRVVRRLSEGERVRLGVLPPEISAAQPQEDGVVTIDADELKPAESNPGDAKKSDDKPAPVPAATDKPAESPTGSATETSGNSLGWPLIMIDDRSERKAADEPQPGEQAMPKEAILAVTDAGVRLSPAIGEAATWYTFRPTAETVEVHFPSGWSAYLTVARLVAPQIDRLGIVLKEKVGNRRSDLLYVDMRFEEKIFLRFRAAQEDSGAVD